MKTKILILYTSKGLGHKVIAQNIAWHLEQAGYETKLGDLLQIQSGRLVKYFDAFHTFINQSMGWLWKFFYTNKIFVALTLPLRIKVAAKNSDRAKKLIEEYNPDLVLVTQGSFAGVIAHLKQTGDYTKPLGVAFSDYHLHRYWLYDEVDFYLVNIEEQKQEMIRLGIPASQIFVCGVTLKPLNLVNPAHVRSNLRLGAKEHLVILAAGSMGFGIDSEHVRALSERLQSQARKRGRQVSLAVICGNNRMLQEELEALEIPQVKVFGYYTPLSDLYQVADVYLTKPGGLSMAEALAYRLPCLVTHFLPGQEELNLNYLLSRHLVMGYIPLYNPDKVAWQVMEEIETGEFRRQLQENDLIERISPTDGRKIIEAVNMRNL